MMKKTLSVWFLFTGVLIGLLLPSTAVFAEEDAEAEEDPGALESELNDIGESVADSWEQTKECAKGFPKFLSTVIDLDNFAPYWVDVFTKNMCFLNDVFELEDELDSIQTSLRENYYACTYEDIDRLKGEYKLKKAEVYFVRHSVGFDVDALTKEEIDNLSSVIAQYLEGTLKPEMRERYVDTKGWFSEPDFDTYFAGWSEEYADNIEKYIDCDYAGWSEVAEKWNELGETLSALKKDEKEVQEEPASAEDGDEEEDEGLGAKDTAGKKVANYFKKHLGFSASFIADVPKDLHKLFDGSGNSSSTDSTAESDNNDDGTINSAYDEYISALDQYENAYLEAELMAKYATLYGEGGADIATSFVDKLDTLSTTLEGSYQTYIPDVSKMTKSISKKQCSD